MNEKQRDKKEFIDIIRADLMEIYKVSKDKANFLIESFQLQELVDKHEIISHYATEELAQMIYERNQRNEMTQEEIGKYVNYIVRYMKRDFGIEEKEALDLIEKYDFYGMIKFTNCYCLHFDPRYWSKEIYSTRDAKPFNP